LKCERQVPANYANAAAIAQEINACDFDKCYFVFNTFKSAVLFLNTVRPVKSLAGDANAVLPEYEVSPESRPEVMGNLQQYAMASSLFTAMLEAAASEQSSRMQAMENASKNAEEMVGKFTMKYNRARQVLLATVFDSLCFQPPVPSLLYTPLCFRDVLFCSLYSFVFVQADRSLSLTQKLHAVSRPALPPN
jgi:hypothetical protein